MYVLEPFALPDGYGELVLPLAEAKAHLSIEASETEFDMEVGVLRDAAVDMVERYCSVILAPRTGMVWVSEGVPSKLRIGVQPVTSVTAMTYLDASNVERTVDASTLR